MNTCLAPCPVVFDLDGTLIDSAPDIHACVNAVLRDYRITPLTLDQVRSFIGGGVDLLWQKIMSARRIDIDTKRELLAAFMVRYEKATALTQLYPNVEDALGILADRGHPLGICTNKPMRSTENILNHFNIRSIFGTVIGGDSLPQKKPDPAPLYAAFKELGANTENPKGIFVGDSEFDAKTAAAIPVPFLLYTRGYRHTPVEDLPHHANFDDFAALPQQVESLTLGDD